MSEMKRYRCPQGHVVGFIRWDGHGASRLLYLQESIDEASPNPPAPNVTAIIDSGDVTCTCCGSSMVWVPSVLALMRLLRSHRKLMDGLRSLQETQPVNPAYLERG